MKAFIICALFALFSVCLSVGVPAIVATGISYCADSACKAQTDCDLGICCGGKCVSTPPTSLAKGAACNASNPCSACPTGQFCYPAMSGPVCTDLPACTYSIGCACKAAADCQSGYCGGDGKCHTTNLIAGDLCIENGQCASKNCTKGLCIGILEGQTCSPYTDSFEPSCAYGLFCQSTGLSAVCVEGATEDDYCNSSMACLDYATSCNQNNCDDWDDEESDDGDNCTMQVDCDQPATCFNGYCQDITDGNCRPGMCGTNQECVCNGPYGTMCMDVNNLDDCDGEFEDFYDCVREAGCRVGPFSYNLFNPELCAYNNCLSELVDWTCCSYCGDDSLNTIASPAYGLTCTDDKNSFVYPQVCTSACTSTGSASSCPALPTTTGEPTQTGSNTGTQTGSNTGTQTGSTQTGATQTVTQTGSKTGSQSSTTMSVTTGETPASASTVAINLLLVVFSVALLF